jgi:hypothetical protein
VKLSVFELMEVLFFNPSLIEQYSVKFRAFPQEPSACTGLLTRRVRLELLELCFRPRLLCLGSFGSTSLFRSVLAGFMRDEHRWLTLGRSQNIHITPRRASQAQSVVGESLPAISRGQLILIH